MVDRTVSDAVFAAGGLGSPSEESSINNKLKTKGLSDSFSSSRTDLFSSSISLTRSTCATVEPKEDFKGYFSLRWNKHGDLLAAGSSDGLIQLLSAQGELLYTLGKKLRSRKEKPVTSVKWRPSGLTISTKSVLVSAQPDAIRYWHAQTEREIFTLTNDEDEHVFSLDFSRSGDKLAAAGKQKVVRIYDEATKTVDQTLGVHSILGGRGHSNRIFAVKWVDENTLLTGGWDNTVLLWDRRTNDVAHYLYGPHITGETICLLSSAPNAFMTGSFRRNDQIEQWDMRNFKRIKKLGQATKGCQIYSLVSHPNGNFVVYGGTGESTSEAAILGVNSDYKSKAARLRSARVGVFSVDCTVGSRLAVAGNDTNINLFKMPFLDL